jgi:hypothetical protein
MKKTLFLTGAIGASLLFAGGDIKAIPASNEVLISNYNSSLEFGTLGIGANFSKRINDNLAVRFNINGLKYSRSSTISDIDYDVDLHLFTVGVLGDYYPFSNNFRLSAGLYYNDNHANGKFTPTPTETFTLGDHTYTGSEIGQVDASVDFNNFAPYVGIGWGGRTSIEGLSFYANAGVLYQGTPNVHALATPNPSLPQNIKDQIKADVEKERQDVYNDVKKYKFYPVLSVGFSYTF